MTKCARRLFSASGICAGKNGVEFGLGHARSRQSTRALDRFRRAHHDYEIDIRFPAGLEQQRHVDDDEPPSRRRRALKKAAARLGDCGMHQPFEALQRLRVAQHPRAKALAINLA